MILVNLENIFFFSLNLLFSPGGVFPANSETYELSSTFYKILSSTCLTEDGGIPQIPKQKSFY